MSTLVVYSDTSDGFLEAWNAVYADARAGSNAGVGIGSIRFGQDYPEDYYVYEGFLSFDARSVGAGSTITSAILNLTSDGTTAVGGYTIEVRKYDWGASLAAGDWVPGADLSAKTLLCHRDVDSGWAINTAYDMTDDAFAANLEKLAITPIVIVSSLTTAGSAPNLPTYSLAFPADTAGTTNDPKLTITYTPHPRQGAFQ